MITLQQFCDKYNGKIAWDGQCVSQVRAYITEVLGSPQLPLLWANGGARLFWDIGYRDTINYEYLVNTPTFVPEAGYIVVFDATPSNSYWHVGIIVEGSTVNILKVFNQNYSVKNICNYQNFNYISPRVLWFIRPKTPIVSESWYDEGYKAGYAKAIQEMNIFLTSITINP
jgi:hypothetical protein